MAKKIDRFDSRILNIDKIYYKKYKKNNFFTKFLLVNTLQNLKFFEKKLKKFNI